MQINGKDLTYAQSLLLDECAKLSNHIDNASSSIERSSRALEEAQQTYKQCKKQSEDVKKALAALGVENIEETIKEYISERDY